MQFIIGTNIRSPVNFDFLFRWTHTSQTYNLIIFIFRHHASIYHHTDAFRELYPIDKTYAHQFEKIQQNTFTDLYTYFRCDLIKSDTNTHYPHTVVAQFLPLNNPGFLSELANAEIMQAMLDKKSLSTEFSERKHFMVIPPSIQERHGYLRYTINQYNRNLNFMHRYRRDTSDSDDTNEKPAPYNVTKEIKAIDKLEDMISSLKETLESYDLDFSDDMTFNFKVEAEDIIDELKMSSTDCCLPDLLQHGQMRKRCAIKRKHRR